MPSSPSRRKPGIASVCVYCGSSNRGPARHRKEAGALGGLLAAAGIELVYGGGKVGLMGAVADGALAAGGKVTGIIPQFLIEAEAGHGGLTRLFVTRSMHVRKAKMFRLADGFVILPGGPGTLDEFFEVLTWRQLGLHDRPIVVVDLGGFWRPLAKLVDGIIARGYARPDFRRLFTVVPGIADVLPALRGDWPPRRPARPKRF